MKIPLSTYRIQFNPNFTFEDAKQIIPYLKSLGLSTVYASPILKARNNSPHGYDVVDPQILNPQLGTQGHFEDLIMEIKKNHLCWVQDIVPNHMAFDSENHWLMDIMENGKQSRYFHYFDMEWTYSYESLKGKLLAPFLGSFYAKALENQELILNYHQNGFFIKYYSHKLPLKIETYEYILTQDIAPYKQKLQENSKDWIKLFGIIDSLKSLKNAEHINRRSDQVKFIKDLLWDLYHQNEEIKNYIDKNVKYFNGVKGDEESFTPLDRLLSQQFFRLAFWKVGTEEINYRRFFNINELIALKQEHDEVFDHVHKFIFQLLDEEKISGLRIDHIDGLFNPNDYLNKLRERSHKAFIIVEKILESKEMLPLKWPVQGTTGYDFLNYVNGVFCCHQNAKKFNKIYTKFSGNKVPYKDLVISKKRLIIGKHMASDIDNLAHLLKRISSKDRHGSDITLYGLKRALVEVLAFFPVYRTYIFHDSLNPQDKKYILEAINQSRENSPALLHELNFIQDFLLLNFKDYFSEEEKHKWVYFVMRFQQFTGSLMAKGFEDTTLYIYNRLISLNDVGSNPSTFGITLEQFHQHNSVKQKQWINSMNTTSTHDTKRGEDVRARINVLSEIPEVWKNQVDHWKQLNKSKKKKVQGHRYPDKNDEYFLYQTLVGSYPFKREEHPQYVERIKNYIIKSVREAKVYTGWLQPDQAYEESFLFFIDELLKEDASNEFLNHFFSFAKQIFHYGILNSLSQTLIKITSVGFPDFYQGAELWDLNLVDPDNRRPVDFSVRKEALKDILDHANDLTALIPDLISKKEEGHIKLFLIYKALNTINRYPDIFQKGEYVPVKSQGCHKDNLIAYIRKFNNQMALIVVPRFFTQILKNEEMPVGPDIWKDTQIIIPDHCFGTWKDVFTGCAIKHQKHINISDILQLFPVSFLLNDNH